MKNKKYFDIIEAKKAYMQGKNIIDILRSQKNIDINTSEIIEIAYDLQAGKYIEHVNKYPEQLTLYTSEISEILASHIKINTSLLDIGAGELTTLSYLISNLKIKPKKIYAFDISWSRIRKGVEFAKFFLGNQYQIIEPFVADIAEIPLLNKSIDFTISNHALEPNGENLKELLIEIFRVTIDKVFLFEPCYEINSKDGKDRMDKFGYVKNIEKIVCEAGGIVNNKIQIKNVANPLNPTVCFIVSPPSIIKKSTRRTDEIFSLPGTNLELNKMENIYYSREAGLVFPTLMNIPILKSNSSILATSLLDKNY